jgi:hypothetical protein
MRTIAPLLESQMGLFWSILRLAGLVLFYARLTKRDFKRWFSAQINLVEELKAISLKISLFRRKLVATNEGLYALRLGKRPSLKLLLNQLTVLLVLSSFILAIF